MADGTLVEHGTIGYERMAGFPLALGVDRTPAVILGEVPGTSWRGDAATFRALLPALPTLDALLRRHACTSSRRSRSRWRATRCTPSSSGARAGC
jgi:hypothetical protein